MRGNRKDPTPFSEASGETNIFNDVPWPKWPYVESVGETHYLDFSVGCISKLQYLAREFSQIVYVSRYELRAITLKGRQASCRAFLRYLATTSPEEWPKNVSEIAAPLLDRFVAFMGLPESQRPFHHSSGLSTVVGMASELRTIIREGWRTGILRGAARPDLGHATGAPKKGGKTKELIYSFEEYKRIKIALAKKRRSPRGNSTKEERAYLAACCCVIFIYTPSNKAGVCSLGKNALRRGETEQEHDVLTILKYRPKPTAHRTPVEKEKLNELNLTNIYDLERGKSEIPGSRTSKNEYGQLTDSALEYGLRSIEEEFDLRDDSGKRLRLSPRKLRTTYENALPKTPTMQDKADAMGHADLETTAQNYEVVTDADHRRFQIGLAAIGAAATGSTAASIACQDGTTLSVDIIERLLSGMLSTYAASCSDPRDGFYAPKDGTSCSKTLACFFCSNMAVAGTDLYRLASLERRITLDLDSGRIQGSSRDTFLNIRSIISNDIFQCFEIRHVRLARKQAQTKLHPIWLRTSLTVDFG
jgi:hypothetical protein